MLFRDPGYPSENPAITELRKEWKEEELKSQFDKLQSEFMVLTNEEFGSIVAFIISEWSSKPVTVKKMLAWRDSKLLPFLRKMRQEI